MAMAPQQILTLIAPNHLDLDSDDDNVSDANEITNGTDPLLADTDGDGVMMI